MNVFAPPTISVGKFAEVLQGSPVLQERSASAYYATCKFYGLDPSFMLAIFKHESDCGRNPEAVVSRYGTKNWGNTRTNSGAVPGAVIQTDRGPFVKFGQWIDGLHDACNRLVAPHYPYAKAGAREVETIIPIWAPGGDNNNVAAYVASVLTNMTKWKDTDTVADLMVREAIIPATNANRPQLPMTPTHITVHETANPDPGANAEMHRRFLANGGGPDGVSFHYCVDDHEAVHLVPDNENAWHAGDGYNGMGNRRSLAIETCVNAGADWGRTRANLARLVATLVERHDIPLANVVQHNRWSGKNCPTKLRANNQAEWKGLLAAVSALVKAPPPAPPVVWKRDVVESYIDEQGQPVTIIRWGGEAVRILGVNLQDIGVSVENERGEIYDRSIQGGAFQAWRKR